ncbi:MAG: isomerase [Rhodospirillaceae bacterium]|nr:isomerase [Rhodospirillaceae bacterium]
MKLRLIQIDTFTDKVLGGNPAAVCPLTEWLSVSVMQAIAAENNLSETAFFVPNKNGGYDLRWFTPNVEVGLCGHATLAAGDVVLTDIQPDADAVTFETKSGPLIVSRSGDNLQMDFPARPAAPYDAPKFLLTGLGAEPAEVLAGDDYVAVYDSAAEVAALVPNFAGLCQLDRRGVVATAPGDDSETDYVLRFFAPKNAVPEDPVTGNVQTELVPYWSERLGKNRLNVRQLSARGGLMTCEARGERVAISGQCVRFLDGELSL